MHNGEKLNKKIIYQANPTTSNLKESHQQFRLLRRIQQSLVSSKCVSPIEAVRTESSMHKLLSEKLGLHTNPMNPKTAQISILVQTPKRVHPSILKFSLQSQVQPRTLLPQPKCITKTKLSCHAVLKVVCASLQALFCLNSNPLAWALHKQFQITVQCTLLEKKNQKQIKFFNE